MPEEELYKRHQAVNEVAVKQFKLAQEHETNEG
jgi:hypothetical protein